MTTSTHKTPLQYLGLGLFAVSLLVFTLMLGLDHYTFTPEKFSEPFAAAEDASEADRMIANVHQNALADAGRETGLYDQDYGSTFAAQAALTQAFKLAQDKVDDLIESGNLPTDKERWEVELPDWKLQGQLAPWMSAAEAGPVRSAPWLFFGLTIGLGILGGLLYIIPKFRSQPGIKHDHIYHSQLTKGLDVGWRTFFLTAGIGGTIVYGFWYLNQDYFWPAVTAVLALLITGIVLFAQGSFGRDVRDAGPQGLSGYLGILAGTYLIGFYILLYWAAQHVVPWVTMVNPLKMAVFGSEASQWFLYGLLYTLIILVMGVRMIAKYRHNKYQIFRTFSVMFFQTTFAFLILEVLASLNLPAQDLKNIWPLDYDFFFGWQLDQFQSAGAVGIFMLFWGVALIVLGVPLMVHFLGKRWYCSWVCGCGGLAETMGDPWRQLSDKSLRAWRFERWIIHGVLVFAIVMTAMTLYSYFSGTTELLTIKTDKIQKWYGFFIGAGFAGVVGTGFYPLMGNRVWCRFGCPLAAYLGLVQRFQSRFRITTNGGQCISCGNCSTYCEMGIDVRAYAQRGQDIVRASCVGCGVCAAVCPRGVLRLENSGADAGYRTNPERVIRVAEGEPISLLN